VDSLVDTNIKGMIYGSQVAAGNMIEEGCGQIWNMEGLGSNGMIQEKTIIYGMSKQALTYFTKALAKELKNTGVLAGRLSPGMMLTDFITRTPDGDDSPVVKEKSFRFVFNALADRPETVAKFFIPRILANKKNNAKISWLTGPKTLWRFATASFKKDRLI
jgi:short-subunit dehydrogenase